MDESPRLENFRCLPRMFPCGEPLLRFFDAAAVVNRPLPQDAGANGAAPEARSTEVAARSAASSASAAAAPAPQAVASSSSESPGTKPRLWVYRPPDWVPLAVRTEPTLKWKAELDRTSAYLTPGEVFAVDRVLFGENGELFLHMADGRGWVFDRKPKIGVLCLPHDPTESEVSLCTYRLMLPCACLISTLKACLCLEEDADAYHVGVAVYGREWAFYGGADGTGVRYLTPGAWAPQLLQMVPLGSTKLTELQVNDIIRALEEEWPSEEYQFLSRNCCHFATEFCRRLGVGALPSSVTRFDVVATREVVNVVKEGKEAQGKATTETFHTKDFFRGLAAYGDKHRQRKRCCPRMGCFAYVFQPCDCVRGVVTLFRRIGKDKPHIMRQSTVDSVEDVSEALRSRSLR